MRDDSAFEAALRRVMEPRQAKEAAERIARRLEARALPPQRPSAKWWPSVRAAFDFAPAWPRVAALACATVLGITIGLSSLGTRIATDLDLIRVAVAEDGGHSVFDLDMGFRP